MPKMLILYYSRTRNTERMAEAVAKGAREISGVQVELEYHVTPEGLAEFDAIVIGVPTYHHDMTINIKKLLEEAAMKNINLQDKIAAAFGSYGWSGEAPRLVLEILKNKFGMHAIEPPLLIRYTPDRTGLEKCSRFGKEIAERLMH